MLACKSTCHGAREVMGQRFRSSPALTCSSEHEKASTAVLMEEEELLGALLQLQEGNSAHSDDDQLSDAGASQEPQAAPGKQARHEEEPWAGVLPPLVVAVSWGGQACCASAPCMLRFPS